MTFSVRYSGSLQGTSTVKTGGLSSCPSPFSPIFAFSPPPHAGAGQSTSKWRFSWLDSGTVYRGDEAPVIGPGRDSVAFIALLPQPYGISYVTW